MRKYLATFLRRLASRPDFAQFGRIDRHINDELRRQRLGQ